MHTSELVYRSESIRSATTVETIGGTRARNIGNAIRETAAVWQMNQDTLAREGLL